MRWIGLSAALLAAGVLASGGGTFAQAQLGTQPKSQMSPTTRAAAQDKGVTSRYLRDAAQTDMLEVEAGKLAITRARSNDVKDFARRMVKDHTDSTKMLKDAVEASKTSVKLPTKLDAAHQKMLDQLKKASAASFDRRYMDMQVKGHKQALALHQGYAAKGAAGPIKDAAGKIAEVVKHHLDLAQQLASKVATPPASSFNPTTGLPRKGA